MQRIYSEIIKNHITNYNQMVFISGPRQVGKTTIAKTLFQNNTDTQYFKLGQYRA